MIRLMSHKVPNETAFRCIATASKLLLLNGRRSQCQQQRGLDGKDGPGLTAPFETDAGPAT